MNLFSVWTTPTLRHIFGHAILNCSRANECRNWPSGCFREIYPWAKASRNLRLMPFFGISLGLCKASSNLLSNDVQNIIIILQKKFAFWQKVKLEAEWTWNGDRWGVLWRVSLLLSLLPGGQGIAVPASDRHPPSLPPLLCKGSRHSCLWHSWSCQGCFVAAHSIVRLCS